MQRYTEHVGVIQTEAQRQRRYETMYYPSFEKRASDIYIITKFSDRLDLLAHQFYGDQRYWVVLAKANRLAFGSIRVPPGIRLRVPYPLPPFEVTNQFAAKQF
jgi:hypothetical protein